MKFSEIDDYPLPDGAVTLWTPSTGLDHHGWQRDNRPLSYDQCALIRRCSTPSSHPHVSWIGAAFTISDSLDPATLNECLSLWMSRHEALLSAPDVAGDHYPPLAVGRLTYRGRNLHMTPNLLPGNRSETSPAARSRQTTADMITKAFDTRLSPTCWPQCLVVTIDPAPPPDSPTRVGNRDDGEFTVVFAADHMVMDAYSIMLSINEITHIYHQVAMGLSIELPPVGSHADFSVTDRSTGEVLTVDHPAVDRWRAFHNHSRDDRPFLPNALAPRSDRTRSRPSVPRQRGISEYLITEAETDAFACAAKEYGHSSLVAIFAALAMAYQQVAGTDQLRFTMPMHTRHDPRFTESVGWYVGLAPVEIDLGRTQTFLDALEVTAQAIESARDLPRYPYHRVAELSGLTEDPRLVASYLDFRRVPGADMWEQSGAHALRGSSWSQHEVYLWIIRAPAGLSLSARYPGYDFAERIVLDFTSAYASVMRNVASRRAELFAPACHRPTVAKGETA